MYEVRFIVFVFLAVFRMITRGCMFLFVSHNAPRAKQLIDADTVKIESRIRLARPLRTIKNLQQQRYAHSTAGSQPKRYRLSATTMRLPGTKAFSGYVIDWPTTECVSCWPAADPGRHQERPLPAGSISVRCQHQRVILQFLVEGPPLLVLLQLLFTVLL